MNRTFDRPTSPTRPAPVRPAGSRSRAHEMRHTDHHTAERRASERRTADRGVQSERAAYERARRASDEVRSNSTVLELGNVHDFEEARRQRDELQREVERRERLQREADRDAEEADGWNARDSRRADKIARYELRKQKEAERQAKMAAKRAACPACHWGLSVLTLLLICISMPIVYSASMPVALASNHAPTFFVLRQMAFAALGYGLFTLVSKWKPAQMRVGLWVLYFAVLIGLAAMAFTPLGFVQSGVKRWIKIPGLPPQQLSELAKIALIGVMADFWSRAARSAQKSYWPWLVAAGLTLPVAGLVVIQPHLSAALLLCALPFFIAWFADVPLKSIATIVAPLFLLVGVGGVLCAHHAMPLLPAYQQERIAAHFGGDADEQGANYQTLQSQRTLVSGGLLGRGPGQSLGKQGHLPEPHTDFIFAVIGEEFGLAGALALLGCYGLLIFFCFQIGHVAETMFEALLCAGVGSLLAIQVICNIGVVTGVLPVTGMPLPFMSYGGSGLLCVLVGLGLVLGVSRGLGRGETSNDETPDGKAAQSDLPDFDRTSQIA
jgi:cell division protein FtsW